MAETFEIKSYSQLQWWLGIINAGSLFAVLMLSYYFILIPGHKTFVNASITSFTFGHDLSVEILAGLALFWGWLATQILRLHDRIHEPYIREWRAIYESDFILRSLLCDFSKSIRKDNFERAYADRRIRKKLMQRLFYDFVGDETTATTGKRMFFYSEMARYWTLALIDLYASILLILMGAYHLYFGNNPSSSMILTLGILIVLSRVISNKILASAHEITIEQVSSVLRDHSKELSERLEELTKDGSIV